VYPFPNPTDPTGPTTGIQPTTGPVGTATCTPATPTVQRWLDGRRNVGETPDHIADELVGSGWNADVAATAALRSLRSSDRRSLLYGTLTVSVGLAALCLATTLHLVIRPDGNAVELAWAITVLTAAAPVAAFAARRAWVAEQESAHVVWSPSRRGWFGALALCTGLVGIVRILTYVYEVAASITGASATPLTAGELAQVLVSVSVTVPLFWWSSSEWRRSMVLVSGLTDPQPDRRERTGRR
jgi:hypothetical protein